MDLQELLEGELPAGAHAARRVDHGRDVAEHLGGRDVGALLPQRSRRFGSEQASRSDLEAFDLRRSDGLGAQQQAGQRLGVHEGGRFDVYAGDRCLGVRDVGRDRSFEDDGAPHEGVGNVGFLLAGPTVFARQPSVRVALPAFADNPRHRASIVTVNRQPSL
jgi:hypothetical protein